MKKSTILVCDDELGVRESLKLILEQDYTLTFAENGAEAIQCAKTHDLDLMIMDVKMPKMNGLEAMAEIKKIKPNIPVLMMTGYESSDVATQAATLGADAYLTKPFDRQKVLDQVHALLPPS